MDGALTGSEKLIYSEEISSQRTEALFAALAFLFLFLFLWRVRARGRGIVATMLFGICALFLFYVLNYRTLNIRLTDKSLKLTFGIFSWTVPLDNIKACGLDEIPALMRLGGAGIHFMSIRGRYRASFNFLEYPRVVVALKRKAGPVRDISFTTRRPDEVLRLLEEAAAANRTADQARAGELS